MKLRKKLLALGLAASILGVSTGYAQDTYTEPSLSKTVTVGDNLSLPTTNLTFTFSLEGAEVEATELVDGTVKKGPADLLTLSSNTLTYSNNAFTDGSNGKISFNVNKGNTETGIYKYTLKESVAEADQLEGMTYDPAVYTIYLYINADGTSNIYAYRNNDQTKVTDIAFDNKYVEESDTNTDGSLHKVSVNKVVAGNLGDKNKDFEFTINLSVDVDGTFTITDEQGTNLGTITTTNKAGSTTINLKDGQTFVIHGLSSSDTYTVTETDYSADGYVTDYARGTESSETAFAAKAMGTADDSITVTNTNNATVPTGVVENIAPFVIILALAGAAGVVIVKRRSYEG
ncbi:MAG: hypothetical protein Q4D88_04800 [Anaerococcus sp.]|nr:hypothetical protein [Anaerococcus sp.]